MGKNDDDCAKKRTMRGFAGIAGMPGAVCVSSLINYVYLYAQLQWQLLRREIIFNFKESSWQIWEILL